MSPSHVPPSTSKTAPAWRRLWQPRRALFWLMLLFNVLSSLMAWALRGGSLGIGATVVLGLLALGNAAAGWWLLARLWREG